MMVVAHCFAVADRLKEYIRDKSIQPDQRVFPICYEAARTMFKKAGEKVRIRLKPHDLRRFAATYVSLIRGNRLAF